MTNDERWSYENCSAERVTLTLAWAWRSRVSRIAGRRAIRKPCAAAAIIMATDFGIRRCIEWFRSLADRVGPARTRQMFDKLLMAKSDVPLPAKICTAHGFAARLIYLDAIFGTP